MSIRLFSSVFFTVVGSFSFACSAMDWLDVQPGSVYRLKTNVSARLVCAERDGREREDTVIIGPESGADIAMGEVKVISKGTPTGISNLSFTIQLEAADEEAALVNCRLELAQMFLGSRGREFSCI